MLKRLALYLLVAIGIFSFFVGHARAAQEIQIIAGGREEFKSEFNAKVGAPGNLIVRVTLKDKPLQAVTITTQIVGALAPQIKIISGSPITINPDDHNKGGLLEIGYLGGGSKDQRARIILSAQGGLSKDLLITASDSQSDFSSQSDPATNGSTTNGSGSPTGTAPVSEEIELDSSVLGCGNGKTKGCNLGDYLTNKDGFVYKSWLVIRATINILLVIALIAISFSNITRISIDTYTIKKALPNLLIGIVLANASMYIIRFLADAATVATYFFVNLAEQKTFKDFIVDVIITIVLSGIDTIGVGAQIVAPLLALLAGIFFFILLVWLAFLLYFRLVAVYLLTILSPLAFIAYGLPGMDHFFKQWWQHFVKWMFMIVPMTAIFWLMWMIADESTSKSIASLLIQIVLFVTAVTMPTKLGGAVMDKASKAFMKYTGTNAARDAAQKYAQNTADRYKERAGLRIQQGFNRTALGKWSAKRGAKWEQDTANIKSDLDIRKDEAATSAKREYRAGQNEEDLKTEKQIVEAKEEILRLGRQKQARKNQERGIELAVQEDEKAIIQLGLDEQIKTESEKALMKDDIAKRKIRAEHQLQKAEQSKEAYYAKEQLSFKEDKQNKDFLLEVFEQINEAEQIQGAVKRSEGILKGNLGREELVLAKHATAYKEYLGLVTDRDDAVRTGDLTKANDLNLKLRKIDIAGIEQEYNSLRQGAGHSYFRDLSIQEAADLIKKGDTDEKIIKAKVSQAGRATDAGVAATIEEAIKTEAYEDALKDYQDIDAAERDKLIRGDAIGVSMKDQHVYASHVQKLLKWGSDRNDYRRDSSLVGLSDMHFGAGGNALSFKVNKDSPPTVLNNITEVESFLAGATPDQKTKLLTEIAKNNRYLVSSAQVKAGHYNK